MALSVSVSIRPGGAHTVTRAPSSGFSNLISVGVPAYGSTGTAGNGNSLDYDAYWSGTGTQTLAYDLSGVASGQRQRVMVSQFCQADSGYSATGGEFQGMCAAYSGRAYMGTYTIQVNSAAGGGSAPTSGWSTVATVTSSGHLSGAHLVDFAGYNWIRINGSGPNGFAIKLEVSDMSSGVWDGWVMCGDSITNRWAGHGGTSWTNSINTGTSGARVPAQLSYGMDCTKASDATVWLDTVLDTWQGRYVALSFGTNDGYGGTGDPTSFAADMLTLANEVLARGMVPIIPTIPWPNSVWSSTNTVSMNTALWDMVDAHAGILRGPDIYALTVNQTSWFPNGDVHPNTTGATAIYNAWVSRALAIYGG